MKEEAIMIMPYDHKGNINNINKKLNLKAKL